VIEVERSAKVSETQERGGVNFVGNLIVALVVTGLMALPFRLIVGYWPGSLLITGQIILALCIGIVMDWRKSHRAPASTKAISTGEPKL
jgi:hypothetical protein